jgi:hypothetical protein
MGIWKSCYEVIGLVDRDLLMNDKYSKNEGAEENDFILCENVAYILVLVEFYVQSALWRFLLYSSRVSVPSWTTDGFGDFGIRYVLAREIDRIKF